MNDMVYEFKKNSYESVKIHLSNIDGKDYVDIRIWVLDRMTEPESMRLTKKGICISPELLPELIKGLIICQKKFREKLHDQC